MSNNKATSLPDLFLRAAARHPDRAAVHWQTADGWEMQTWAEVAGQVGATVRALDLLGVGEGTAVGIVSQTRPEWCAADLAILALGGVVVGLYPTLLAADVVAQLHHAKCQLVIVEDAAQAAKITDRRDELPHLTHVLTLDPVPGLMSLPGLLGEPDPQALVDAASARARSDVATIIYTSGTTGQAKGAVLTHGNFLAAVEGTRDVSDVRPGDRGVCFLPLAHALQRWGVYLGYELGVEGYFARSVGELPATLREARARTFVSVPRMLEKIQAEAEIKAARRGTSALAVFRWAFEVGGRRWDLEQAGERVPRRLRLRHRVARRLVFRKVKEALGGELEVLGCGGARLDPELARWFGAMGVTVLEGWGLTETSAPATANQAGALRVGSVGRPLPGVHVRVADDGELQVRGEVLFRGYLNDADATAAAFDGEWFCTGDIGHVDSDGFVWITGRKKQILVLANGKNVAPEPIESLLCRHPWIAHVMLIGDDRAYLTALIALDEEALAVAAERERWPGGAQRWAQSPEVRGAIDRHIAECCKALPSFQQPKRWSLLPAAFREDLGELTPTLKLRRAAVAQAHAAAIEELYP